MNLTIEEQIARYADAIDPSQAADALTDVTAGVVQKPRRMRPAMWLSAAAASVLIVALAIVFSGRGSQQVDTTEVAQLPEGEQQTPSLPRGERLEPIYWPGGSTDPGETLERFLDESFPEWRELGLMVDAREALIADGATQAQLVDNLGEVFANAPMRAGDGRWLINEITSPAFDIEVVTQSNMPEAIVVAEVSGMIEVVGLAAVSSPTDRQVVAQRLVEVRDRDIAQPLTASFDANFQEVHARMKDSSGATIGFAAFTVRRVPAIGMLDATMGAFEPDADVATGFWQSREQQLQIFMAEVELLGECADEHGVQIVRPTNDELIHHFGGWSPNGILGLARAGAAEAVGYQSAGFGGAGSPTQTAYAQQLTATERETSDATLMDCLSVVREQLGQSSSRLTELSNQLFGADETQGEKYREDPVLAGAIWDWQDCVRDRVGEEADTPNELARRFAFESDRSTADEIAIAVADVSCQEQTDLEIAFFRARTAALMADPDTARLLNEYAELNLVTMSLVEDVLSARGVVPPSLD